ncbi:MAG: PucR family transcriptional regulator ligand-binding domain-containing protein [bacterium]|nr:PucR family transcriptional regulator ligand-binding domain-containing protein [bacterium]
MAITLQKLCEKASYQYGLRILAGEEGMKNIVQWTHTLEEVQASEFLHGGELIFTTGIAYQDNSWLLAFIQQLKIKKASGLIVNFGPYLAEIPREVITYCNQVGFPLLEIPWKTHIVDMTRDFCNQIIQSEKEEGNIGDAFEAVIFSPNEREDAIKVLERYDFKASSTYSMIAVHPIVAKDNTINRERLKAEIENQLYRFKHNVGYFLHGDVFYFVLCDYIEKEVEEAVSQIQLLQYSYSWMKQLFIAIGPQNRRIHTLFNSYQKTNAILALEEKKKKSPIYYERFGMNKIFLSVNEPELLQEYYEEVLGKLERYDRENDTDHLEFLKRYLENDCCVQKIASMEYVHRNTINYRISKIKSIVGHDITSVKYQVKLMMAYQIKELL